ncbi:MAG: leucine-rich repeat protein, partial [Rikenellaceae bacterium]|nr:leucine-rich repeat protein [Rikenellaceae bacterium]
KAFYYCERLIGITIPENVTMIGAWAFVSCSALSNVYCKAINPPTLGSKAFNGNASGRKIYVPAESVDAYKSAEGWSDYADDIVGYDF